MYDQFWPSDNYIDDSEALLKRTKAKLKKVSALESEDNLIWRSLAPEFECMADKTLREFSVPTIDNIRTGPTVNVGDNGFELKPALINMVKASQFVWNDTWRYKCTSPTLPGDL